MLLQMALFHSFLWLKIFHCINASPLLYPFLCQWTLGCFSVLVVVSRNNTTFHVPPEGQVREVGSGSAQGRQNSFPDTSKCPFAC